MENSSKREEIALEIEKHNQEIKDCLFKQSELKQSRDEFHRNLKWADFLLLNRQFWGNSIVLDNFILFFFFSSIKI